MTHNTKTFNASRWRSFIGALALICAATVVASAQTPLTPGGTVITNTATSSYSDGTNSYATTSNTVSVTVSNVAGLTITPDGGSHANVVRSQTGVDFLFTVTNTGNFTNQVVFKALGASIVKTGAASVTAAVIDLTNDGIGAGDTDILANAADVTSANVLQDGTLHIVVRVTVDAGAASGSFVDIQLGDAGGSSPYDNVPVLLANFSANEVRTATAGTNGYEEARGNVTATVEDDALIRLSLTADAGPVAIGSDIAYSWVLTNDGDRTASAQTLTVDGLPLTGVFIIAPIPARTVLKSGQAFVGSTNTIYTTTAIATAPLAATWSATAPGDLNTVTRIGFRTGNVLIAGASTTAISMLVTVKSGISIVLPVRELGDAFSMNDLPIPVSITDQSHDLVSNAGDGNADFTQGDAIGSVDGDGVMLNTLLSSTGGSVLLGPMGFQAAVGPTDNNDDYTNRSVNTGIASVAPGLNTTAQGIVTFTNTVANTGNADDTYTFTAPTIPSGFTVEVSVNGVGTDYVNVNTSPTLAVAYSLSANILVRVTAPSGNVVLTEFPTVIQATSLNTNTENNQTIDNLYTGYLKLDKSQTVANATGRGTLTEAVPGATIAYVVAYDNMVTSTGGTNNSTLTASSIVLLDPVPADTDFKVGSATSNPAVGITGVVTEYSNDGGTTWTYTPVSGGGSAPAGYDRNVNRVRFTLTGPVAPADLAGNNGFTVRIR
jgi:hypothetical protein